MAPLEARLVVSATALPLLLVLLVPSAQAVEPCEPVAARVVSVQGRVEVQAPGSARWSLVVLDSTLCVGDTVRVGALSRAALELPDNPTLRLDQLTTLRLVGTTESGNSWLDLLFGAVHFFSRRPHALRVDTPVANAGTEGTEFLLRVSAERTEVVTFEGRVRLTTAEGELLVASGDAAVALAGAAPARQVVVRPRDAVAWALYYPPILAPLAERGAASPLLPPGLQAAIDLVAANDYAGAIAALDEVPEAARDARYDTYRAGVLLNVGQAEAAEEALARALTLDPAAADALAERAVLRVVQNRRDEALADARRAVELAPALTPARIALSYALQASFELEAARQVLREAVEQDPEDALAWARLAELEQSFGDLDAVQTAAERAVALAPTLAVTQMVLGFAALTRIDIDQAKAAFERAIALDSTLPLARLGLGLAKIRAGDLNAGGRDLEIAVALDPNNSLLRSYLGKAYFEERRAPLDAEQFQIAKQLDPNDPTPWFYDAIRLQTENRPVEALRNLDRSIALNDNRAVYRSRLLLDEDLAARGTSLGRIYDNLGFQERGVVEASRSLALDPGNAAAHRFLSDLYGGIRRREVARVSELLQAQLLQDVNLNPVQPSLSETSVNVVTQGSATDISFNQFTPLFAQNQTQLDATGIVGNNTTFGGEAVVSVLQDRLSASAGAFHYQTDGFRTNNDFNENIYNGFVQAAITPKINLQAEVRRRDSNEGDLALDFDQNVFDPDLERKLKQNMARAGARISPAPGSDILLSLIYGDRDESAKDFPGAPREQIVDDTSVQIESQYIIQKDHYNAVIGAGYGRVDRETDLNIDFGGGLVFGPERDSHIDQYRGYIYNNITYPHSFTWTLGLSIDEFDQQELNVSKVNPKLGLRLNVSDDVDVRAVVLRNVKQALATNQTIEPTQVAGFNQFYDDINATASWLYGVGLDWRLMDELLIGAEATWRDLSVPILIDDGAVLENQDEETYRLYTFWTPTSRLAINAQFVYDRFKSQEGNLTGAGEFNFGYPKDVKTFFAPIEARYFHPSGLFGSASATFVDQDVERSAGVPGASGRDRFVVVDAAVGWRLAGRRGVVSVGVSNLLNTDLQFQDDSFREFQDQPSIGPFFPERTIFARLTLSL